MTRFWSFCGLMALLARGVCAGPDAVSISCLESMANVFAGDSVAIRFSLRSPAVPDVRMVWQYAAQGATLSRGETALPVGADGAMATVELTAPQLKPGVEQRTLLNVTLCDARDGRTLTSTEEVIWVFGRDAFHDRHTWLKGLNIALFDPEDTTGPLLEAAEIPFARVRSADAQAEAPRVFIVGEGVSFAAHRGLWKDLIQLAAKGNYVLVLAPSEGDVGIPHASDELPDPQSMIFRGREVIHLLDKRLDAQAPAAASLRVEGWRGGVIGKVAPADEGWLWFETDFASGGKLCLCGVAVMSRWNKNPAPRYLFSRLLAYGRGKEEKGNER